MQWLHFVGLDLDFSKDDAISHLEMQKIIKKCSSQLELNLQNVISVHPKTLISTEVLHSLKL